MEAFVGGWLVIGASVAELGFSLAAGRGIAPRQAAMGTTTLETSPASGRAKVGVERMKIQVQSCLEKSTRR
jgi:hypothetical protein